MEPKVQPQFTSYAGVTKGNVSIVGGAITLNNSTDGTFKVANSGGSVFNIKQAEGDLKINSVGGNLTLEIPQGVTLNLNNVGGAVTDNRGASAVGGKIAQVLPDLSALRALRFSSEGGSAASSVSSSSSASASVAVAVAGYSTSTSSVGVTQQSDQTFHSVSKIEGINKGGNIEILVSPDKSVRVTYGSALLDQEGNGLDVVNSLGSQMTIYAPKEVNVQILNQGGTLVDKRYQS